MTVCRICGQSSPLVARALGVCGPCAREGSPRAQELARIAHAQARQAFGLPPERPDEAGGPRCRVCANECRPAEGGLGLCGLRRATAGRTEPVTGAPTRALVEWYYDPLPTNCCADWVCPGGSACGYPEHSYAPGPEVGYRNLAVFYFGCSFDCLFCQNWQCRRVAQAHPARSAESLARAVDSRTSCICFFGGDPSPQMAHSLRAARLARARAQGRHLRVCWETNGSLNRQALRQAADLALESGGCIKVDLKAHDDLLHRTLCGVSNARTLESFAYLAERARERPRLPLLVAATLLVPGYVDEEEVGRLAALIASLDPGTPYVLLAFHPSFALSDLPATPRAQAERCGQAARAAGLTRVRLGNVHL
jgi:pyruvate formate lyase activating enzyme